jgi:hypothetical protein
MAVDDFIMTINSDDEERPLPKGLRYAASQNVDPEDAQLNTEFTFDLNGDPYTDMIGEFYSHDLVKTGSRPVSIMILTYNAPIHRFLLSRNQYLLTISSRDANCLRILGSANEIPKSRQRMS